MFRDQKDVPRFSPQEQSRLTRETAGAVAMTTVAIEGAAARTHTSGLSPAYHVPTSQSLFNPCGTCGSNSIEPVAYQTSPVRLLEGVDTPSVSAHTNEVTRPRTCWPMTRKSNCRWPARPTSSLGQRPN